MSDIIWTIGPLAINANPACLKIRVGKGARLTTYKQLWQNILIRVPTKSMKMAKPTVNDIAAMRSLFDRATELHEEWVNDEIDHTTFGECLETLVETADFGSGRILFGLETLLENCADPDLDHLAFSPEIRQGLWLRDRLSWAIALMDAIGIRPWGDGK
jgi:hypothetical protein